MVKNKSKILIVVLLALTLLSVFFMQNSLAYFSDIDNVPSNEISIPYASKTIKANGSTLSVNDTEQAILETTNQINYSLSVEITTNYASLVRVSITSTDKPTYSTGWKKATNIYSPFYEEDFADVVNYDAGYAYYTSIVQPSEDAQSFIFATLSSTVDEDVFIDVQIIQANAYGLEEMWLDNDVTEGFELEYRVDETLVVLNNNTLITKSSNKTYNVQASSEDELQLRFTYPYQHKFIVDGLEYEGDGDLSISLTESKTYNITLKILNNFDINYKIVVTIG